MTKRPVYQSQLFRQIFKSLLTVVVFVMLLLALVINHTIDSSIQEEHKVIKAGILNMAGNQIKRALLIEDISQLNSFAKLVVDNPRNGVVKIEVNMAGESEPLASYPPRYKKVFSCALDKVSLEIKGMYVGSLNICFDETAVSSTIIGLTPKLIGLIALGGLVFLLIVLRIVSQHVNRVYLISNAIRDYSNGDKTVQVEVKNHNELGNLETFFNQMVANLNTTQERLRRTAFYNQRTHLENKQKLIEDLPSRNSAFEVNIFVIEGHDYIEQTFGQAYANQATLSFIECLQLHLGEGALYQASTDTFIVLDAHLNLELMEHLTGQLTIGVNANKEVHLKVKGTSFICDPAKGHEVTKTILRMIRHIKNKSVDFMALDEQAFSRVLKGYQIAENLLQGHTQGLQVYAQVIYPIPEEMTLPHIELLVRYQDDEHGLITPYYFLDQVVELGGIHALDRFMLAQAETLLTTYAETGLVIFINLTPAMIFSLYFQEWIEDRQSNTALKNAIVFEVNEAFFIEMSEESKQVFKQIHRAGFKIALDDFGSGFSSYNWLSQLPISYLKIDRSLILAEGNKADQVLASISTLAADLGIITIDEGVETQEQYGRAKAHGFDQVQGFYFDRPGPVEEKIQKITAL